MSASDVSMPTSTPDSTPDNSQQAPPLQTALSGSPTPQPPASVTQPTPSEIAPGPAPASSGGSMWRGILAGALAGLANSGGATSFGGGLARGTAGALAAEAQRKAQADAAAQQQVQNQQQADIHSVQMAQAYTSLAEAQHRLMLLPDTRQQQILETEAKNTDEQVKAGAVSFVGPATQNAHDAMDAVNGLMQKDPSKFYRVLPVFDPQGNVAFQPAIVNNAPTQSDLELPLPDGTTQTIKAGSVTGVQFQQAYVKSLLAQVQDHTKQAAAGMIKANAAQQNANTNQQKAATAAQNATAGSVYAYDPKADQTVLTTPSDAQARGLQGMRKVNQTQLASDVHNASVLNDVSQKTQNVLDSVKALDQDGRQKDIISWALGDNGIKIGFGDHLALPMDALVNNSLNARNMGQATPLTKNYIVSVLSLREAAMGMNRVLTGSARASESQIKALQATLPGYDPDSSTALTRIKAFAQNVDNLRKPIPQIPGVPRIGINLPNSSGNGGSF